MNKEEFINAGKLARNNEIIDKLKKDLAFMENEGLKSPLAEAYFTAFCVIITELESYHPEK